jgi:hypothetical protein
VVIHLFYHGNRYFVQQSYKSTVLLPTVIGLHGYNNRKLEKLGQEIPSPHPLNPCSPLPAHILAFPPHLWLIF